MFWGLIMEPGRCYSQKVKVSFHVSMAALDISNSSDEPAQVMCVFEGRNYLLCTLNKKDKLQCPLDLNFETGSKVSFATNGKAHVHLTGYLTTMEDDYLDEGEEEEEAVLSKKEKKRAIKQAADGPPTKKTKTSKLLEEEIAEEDSSDSDFDLDKLVGEEESGDEEELGVEEEGEEEEGEEEEASSLSDEEEESEEEETQIKPKQNGIAKPNTTPAKKQKKEQKQEKPKKEEKKQQQQQQQPKLKKSTTLKGGVSVQELKEGTGEPAKSGKFVHVYYEGRLKENNKVFDSTSKGPGFSFRLGKGEVIKGWDIGLVGMKVGGKRRIICPPNCAYGPKGSPPVIPPNATLVFDVELKKVS